MSVVLSLCAPHFSYTIIPTLLLSVWRRMYSYILFVKVISAKWKMAEESFDSTGLIQYRYSNSTRDNNLKQDISLLVTITQSLYTLAWSASVVVYRHRPPKSAPFSKHTGSRPSSMQHLVDVRPHGPAPIIATLIIAESTLMLLKMAKFLQKNIWIRL